MSTSISRPRWALLAACGFALLIPAGSASAAPAPAKTGATVRVVNSAGQTLAEHVQYTGPTTVKASRKADCFGPDNPSSNKRHALPDPNAIGIVSDAAENRRKLRPLLLSDAFLDEFGSLGVCAIGGFSAPNGFWFLKHDHAAATAGGNQVMLGRGDDVLWYLIDDFNEPSPAELEIRSEASVKKGQPITVRAFEYDDAGKRAPAAGVRIEGTAAVTGANGVATVPASGKRTRLRGLRPGAIPSNRLVVCQRGMGVRCPSRHPVQVRGTNRKDRIKVGPGPAAVRAFGGGDVVNLRRSRGGVSRVNCGPGKDRVIARKGQRVKRARNCERLVRR